MRAILITPDEANLPPPKGAIAVSSRGVTRGPKIELVSQTSAVHSPTNIQLKFQTFDGAKIDLNAVQATYLRTPNVVVRIWSQHRAGVSRRQHPPHAGVRG